MVIAHLKTLFVIPKKFLKRLSSRKRKSRAMWRARLFLIESFLIALLALPSMNAAAELTCSMFGVPAANSPRELLDSFLTRYPALNFNVVSEAEESSYHCPSVVPASYLTFSCNYTYRLSHYYLWGSTEPIPDTFPSGTFGCTAQCNNNMVFKVEEEACGCGAGMRADKIAEVCYAPPAGINFGAPPIAPSAPPQPPVDAPNSMGPAMFEKSSGGGGGQDKCNSPIESTVADPINIAVGNLIEPETDFIGKTGGGLPLSIERTYNSLDLRVGIFGNNWSSNIDTRASLKMDGSSLAARLSSGQVITFNLVGGSWVSSSSVRTTLVENGSGRLLTTNDGSQYQFDSAGFLTSLTNATGEKQLYEYVAGQLVSVTDNYGNVMEITYNALGLVDTVEAFGQVIRYEYNTSSSNPAFKNLTRVIYPASNGVGVLSRQYKYENLDFPWALTGLINEDENRVATWGYDSKGLANYNNRAGLEEFTINYSRTFDALYPYTTVTNAKGHQWKYHLKAGGDALVRVIRVEGLGSANCPAASKYTSYDANDRPITVTDHNGNVTLRHFTGAGLVDQLTEGYRWAGTPTGNIGSLVETPAMRKQVVTTWDSTNTWPTQLIYSGKDLSGNWVSYQREDRVLDLRGRLKRKTITDLTNFVDPYPSNLRTQNWQYSYTYHDPMNTKIHTVVVQDPRENTVTTTFDNSGRKIRVDRPVSSSLTLTTNYGDFNAAGLPQLVTDANAIPTLLAYDARNRLRQVVRNAGAPGAQVTTFDYYESGNLKRVTLNDGSWLNYTYSDGVHLSRIDDNMGSYVILTPSTLDGRWTQRRVFDSSGLLQNTRNRVFDDLGRIVQILDAAGTTVKSTLMYGSGNNLESILVGYDFATQIIAGYDALRRLTELSTPDGSDSKYRYDEQGNLAEVIDARNLVTRYTYDGFGNLMKLQSADSGVTKFWYDAAGNNIKKLDARGVEALYSYDALNRRTEITYPASPAESVSYTYDYDGFSDYSKGYLSYINDADGYVVVGSYDPFGNVLSKIDWLSTVSAGSDYIYDGANRVTGVTYPSGRLVTYTRNDLGQITQVQLQDNTSAPLQMLVSNVTYKPFGPISGLSFGNGVDTEWLYDSDYRLGRITTTSVPRWDYTYHYDQAGNIDELTDQVGSNDRLYTYDKVNRLMLDNKPIFGSLGYIQYDYDRGGNRILWKQGTSSTLEFEQNYVETSNRQIEHGTTLLLYDDAGNLTNYGSRVFGYDSANRMSLSIVGSTSTSYRYNGLGQRTTKLATTSGNTVITHYDYDKDGKYLGQIQANPNGTFVQGDEYIWLDDMPIAQVHTVYGVNNAIASQQLTYIHADHLNTPRAMTNSGKKVVWKWESEAYGRNAPNTDPDLDGVVSRLDLRFPGQIADAETGFYYNMNRYYDPITGRYTQSDPIGLAGGLNLYAYVNGNPIRYADPTGQNPVAVAGGLLFTYTLYEGYQYCKGLSAKADQGQEKSRQREAAIDDMMAGRPYSPSDIEAAKDAEKEFIDSALDVINHLPPGTSATPFDSVRDRKREGF